jgi:PEP-CTERM motif
MSIARALGMLAVTVGLASPAQASLITLNFSGTADLSQFGASAASTFQGSVTWDSNKVPVIPGVTLASYFVEAFSISINSVDYTSSVLVPSIEMMDSAFGDYWRVASSFSPFLDLGPDPDDLYLFGGFLRGPTSMFSSTALPADLNFLSAVTTANSLFVSLVTPAGGSGTFVVVAPTTAVPEPSAVLLVASGLLGLVARRRNNRNSVS